MFYRVDYALAVVLAGFLGGILFGGTTKNAAPSRLARGYYAAAATLIVLRAGAFACTMLASHANFWSTSGKVIGDLSGILLGLLFGLAIRRSEGREFLTNSSVLGALRMT